MCPTKIRKFVMLNNGLIIDNIYQIISEIGSGGMGVIYLGYHLRLRKYIVLKKLKDSRKDIRQLRNEVDILKGLHHSYLPQVYDFINYNGSVYTVIDYIEGYDLKYYIDNNYQITEGQLIKWLRQLCEVLDYLHSHNPQVLHSDIKPANIIITTNGDICLIDFGISLYNTNVIMGLSMNYSSPEQLYNYDCEMQGIPSTVNVDSRTDIFSLGVTLYHVMTRYTPSIKNYPPPPISEFDTGYSEQLQDIIQKAMSYQPADRYQSARQMLKAVDNMKKQDARYKGYVIVQILSSLFCVMLIIGGVLMVYDGMSKTVTSSFQKEYSEFVSLVSKGSPEIGEKGREILNNSDYRSVLDDDKKADIFHAIGDYYYDNEDYYNAAYNYSDCLSLKKSEINYRDYTMALISDNRIDEAKNEIQKIQSEYSSSPVVSLLNADICYKTKDYKNAVSLTKSLIQSLSNDSENLYTANYILGKSLSALNQSDKAIEAYEAARQQKETALILRTIGSEQLKKAEQSGYSQDYKNAYNTFKLLDEKYCALTDDIINLAQSAMLAGDNSQYDFCKNKLLDETAKNEDCRVYIMLCMLSDATSDNQTEGYLKKTRELYNSLSQQEKSYISSESLAKTKELYRQYCGQEWE